MNKRNQESIRRSLQLRNQFNTKSPWFFSDTFFSIFFGSILTIIVAVFAFQGYMFFRMAPAIMKAPDVVNHAVDTADKGLTTMDHYMERLERESRSK